MGRSQPAPTARVIPAGRLFRVARVTRVPSLAKFLEDQGCRIIPVTTGLAALHLTPRKGAYRVRDGRVIEETR